VRAPINVLEPATRFLEGLGSSHPKSCSTCACLRSARPWSTSSECRSPNQFNLFNIPIGALGLTLAGGQSIQTQSTTHASGRINQGSLPRWPGCSVSCSAGMRFHPQPNPGNVWWGSRCWSLTGHAGRTTSRTKACCNRMEHVTPARCTGKDVHREPGLPHSIINARFRPHLQLAGNFQASATARRRAPFLPSRTRTSALTSRSSRRARRFGCEFEC